MEVTTRAGRVRELTSSSRSKFKMALHQFSSIVQFPSHQSDWKVRSVQFGARWPSASVQFGSIHSVHFTNFSAGVRGQSRSRSRRHISVGAEAVGTFFSEPEPNRLKKVSTPAPNERKIIKKKTQNVKREDVESIIFTAQFLPISRTGEFE